MHHCRKGCHLPPARRIQGTDRDRVRCGIHHPDLNLPLLLRSTRYASPGTKATVGSDEKRASSPLVCRNDAIRMYLYTLHTNQLVTLGCCRLQSLLGPQCCESEGCLLMGGERCLRVWRHNAMLLFVCKCILRCANQYPSVHPSGLRMQGWGLSPAEILTAHGGDDTGMLAECAQMWNTPIGLSLCVCVCVCGTLPLPSTRITVHCTCDKPRPRCYVCGHISLYHAGGWCFRKDSLFRLSHVI